jgi:hypothetical protein
VRVLLQEVPQCLQVAQDPDTVVSRHRTAQLQHNNCPLAPSADTETNAKETPSPAPSSHPATLLTRMLTLMTYTCDESSDLVDTGRSGMESNLPAGRELSAPPGAFTLQNSCKINEGDATEVSRAETENARHPRNIY